LEYIVVNNGSTDKTLQIASTYAKQDNRVKVVSNRLHVGVIENHNIAFRLISEKSRYCKVVAADDYLFPVCIQNLVEVAERNPRVAIVGSYAIDDKGIRWIGFPPDKSVFDGREVCRLYLLGAIDSFGTPSSVLYRSALVRSRDAFYPGSLPNADLAACLICLEATDFAFVHQILSYERIHTETISSSLRELNAFVLDRIQFLSEYGPTFLNTQEIETRAEQLQRALYEHLAVGIVNLKGRQLLNYYRGRLEAIGCKVSTARIIGAVGMKFADLLFNPKQTFEKVLRRLEGSVRFNYRQTPKRSVAPQSRT
jgi:glycosyltransferase involved in cell wall biosynthesis